MKCGPNLVIEPILNWRIRFTIDISASARVGRYRNPGRCPALAEHPMQQSICRQRALAPKGRYELRNARVFAQVCGRHFEFLVRVSPAKPPTKKPLEYRCCPKVKNYPRSQVRRYPRGALSTRKKQGNDQKQVCRQGGPRESSSEK